MGSRKRGKPPTVPNGIEGSDRGALASVQARSDIKGKPRRVYTIGEVHAQLDFAQQLLLNEGLSANQRRAMFKAKFGTTDSRASIMLSRAAKLLEEQFKASRIGAAQRQVQRIGRVLEHALGERAIVEGKVVWERPPAHSAVARYEDLLARIYGTEAPKHIHVDANVEVRESLVSVAMSLDPQVMDEYLSAALKRQELAAVGARALGEGDAPEPFEVQQKFDA